MKNFVPRKQEKEVISIRINSNTLEYIDRIAAETDISRNEMINQCIEYALKNLDMNHEN